ncbi:MAG: hypothetical protein HDS61_00710 [Barnesiella sp.]|nr:hypothetical protein [Barnesiella sp.]
MKKTAILMLAAAASLGFVACDSKTGATVDKSAKSGGDKEVLYTGVLPAADAQGILYTLKLDFDDDNNYTDGDFVLVENPLMYDSITPSGLKVVASSFIEGDFTKESKQVNGAAVDYLRLVPDVKESIGDSSSTPMYFIVNADESVTLVNDELQLPSFPDLYTLKVEK